jgi:mono/diheme cytochrome c family protein
MPFAITAADETKSLRDRGEYVMRAAGCASCHTDAENDGQFLAGGRALETPFGVFYSPNITFDPVHGIGDWSVDDLANALGQGIAPDGSHYYPVFPYPSYTGMTREDVAALHAYLASVPPSPRPNRPHELVWYMDYRIANWAWKLLFFTPGPFQADADGTSSWNRGAYLVRALAHCGECHTPRTAFGNLDWDLAYAGTDDGPDGDSVPNITPDGDTGIGDWSADELTDYLGSGLTPDGDFAGGLMAEVIDDGLGHLDAGDLAAIVVYLRALPPIRHRVGGESEKDDDPYQ